MTQRKVINYTQVTTMMTGSCENMKDPGTCRPTEEAGRTQTVTFKHLDMTIFKFRKHFAHMCSVMMCMITFILCLAKV